MTLCLTNLQKRVNFPYFVCTQMQKIYYKQHSTKYMPTVETFLPCTNKKVQKATSRNILLSWLIENRPRPVLLAKFLGLFDSSFPPNPKVSGVRFFGCRGWVRKKRRRRGVTPIIPRSRRSRARCCVETQPATVAAAAATTERNGRTGRAPTPHPPQKRGEEAPRPVSPSTPSFWVHLRSLYKGGGNIHGSSVQ